MELRNADDPFFYVQNASISDSTLAPRGHSTLYVLMPVSHQHARIDGGSTHPGSGLPVIFESARISSNLLLTSLGHVSENRAVPQHSSVAA